MKLKTDYRELTTLLYIEPVKPRSEKPLIDIYTMKMTEALRRPTDIGALCGFSQGSQYEDVLFRSGLMTKGFHTCDCQHGWSSNQDYQLIDGSITNSLAIHYLAYHREEIPQAALDIIMRFPYKGEEPDLEELQGAIWLSATKREGVKL